MKNKINKIAIVGFGNIAAKHLNILERLYPHISIYIVTKRKLKTKYVVYKSIYSLKNKGIDAIFITSPANEHYKILNLFYRDNIHFFIEKPIFEKTKNIKLISEHFSKLNSPILQVGYVFRHDELFLKFKSLINSKILGTILKADIYCGSDLNSWRPNTNLKNSISLNKNQGGGVLLELSHEIDYCLWLFGDIKVIFSKLNRSGIFNSKVEDTAELNLSTRSKVNIRMHLNFWQKIPERYCKIYGTKGFIIFDIIERKITINSNNINKCITFKSQLDNAYENQIKNFFNCIIYRKKSLVNLSDSLSVLKIIDVAKKFNVSKKDV